MPRKSSFLMGFETGQDLYSRGFQRSQQRAQLQLQRDAADQRKQLLDLQMREANRQVDIAERERADDKLGNNAWDAFLEVVKVNKWDFQDSDHVKSMRKTLQPFLPNISKSDEALKSLDLWRDVVQRGEGARAIKTAGEVKTWNTIFKAQTATKRAEAVAEKIKNFNDYWGTTYTEIGDVNYWADAIPKLEDNAIKTGTYELSNEFEGYDRLVPVLEMGVRKFNNTQTVEDKQIERHERIKLNVLRGRAEVTQYFSDKKSFDKYAQESGNPEWDFSNPAHKAEAVTHRQKAILIPDFAEGGPEGIALLAAVPAGKSGGYDQEQLAIAMGNLETLKTKMKKSGQAAPNLTEAQSKTIMYTVAMYQANQTLDALEKKGYTALTLKDRALFSSGTVVGMSGDGQRYVTAMGNWNNAKLRKDSGAAITEAEVKNYEETLFPRLGEKGVTINEKRKVRDAAYYAMKVSGGPQLEPYWEDMEANLGGISPVSGTRTPGGPTPGASPKGFGGSPNSVPGSQPKEVKVRIDGNQDEAFEKLKQLMKDGQVKEGDWVEWMDPKTSRWTPVQVPGGEGEAPTPEQPSAPKGEDPKGGHEDMGDYPPVPPVIQKPSVSSLGEVPPAPAPDDVGGMEGLKRGFVDLFKSAETPLAVDSDDFGGMMEEKELEFGKLSEESSAARKLWEKDKYKSQEWYDKNYKKDNLDGLGMHNAREQGLAMVGKTITVRQEKFTVLEAGNGGLLVKDAEGNEHYILNKDLLVAPPVPRDK